MPSRPRQALPHAIVRIDDEDAQRRSGPGSGSCMPSMVAVRPSVGGTDPCRVLSAERRVVRLRHRSRIDGSGCAAAPGPARPAAAGAAFGTQHLDRGARAGLAATREPGADPGRAGPHAGQPEVPGRDLAPDRSPCRRRRSASARRSSTRPTSTRTWRAPACLTTLWSASCAIRYRTSSIGQRQPLVERALDHDRQPDPTLERGGMRPEGAGQAVLLQVAGPQLEDQRPHLGEGLALQLPELGELGPGGADIAVEEHLDRARDQASSRTAPGSPSRAARGPGGRAPRRRRARRPGGAGHVRAGRAR